MNTPYRKNNLRGFTLIELLTVIAIIAILAAILMPTLQNVRNSARAAQCLSQMRQIGSAYHLFAHDNDGLFPMSTRRFIKSEDRWSTLGWAATAQGVGILVGHPPGMAPSNTVPARPDYFESREMLFCPTQKLYEVLPFPEPWARRTGLDGSTGTVNHIGYFWTYSSERDGGWFETHANDNVLLPPTRVLLADLHLPPWYTYDSRPHENSMNVLYLGGHVVSISKNDLDKAYSDAPGSGWPAWMVALGSK